MNKSQAKNYSKPSSSQKDLKHSLIKKTASQHKSSTALKSQVNRSNSTQRNTKNIQQYYANQIKSRNDLWKRQHATISTIQPTMKKKSQEKKANKENQELQKFKLLQENRQLRNKYCELQSSSLKDKEKIKTLISRLSSLKQIANTSQNNQMSANRTNNAHKLSTSKNEFQNVPMSFRHGKTATPIKNLNLQNFSNTGKLCDNPACQQRKKYLQIQLYKQRIKRDQLERQKTEWQHNRERLKGQYRDLLREINNLKQQGE